MAHKQTYPRTHSSGHKSQVLWSGKNLKPSTLPPLRQAKGHSKSKMKTWSSIQPVQSQTSVEMANLAKNLRGLRRREQAHHGKMQAKVRLMRSMLRNQRTSLQELYSHEGFLSKLNQELVKSIQDMEETMAMNVREMLQQQGILGNVIDILEYSNKKRVQQLRSELQEWKEKEESKINSLQQEVDQLNAEILKAHEEVNFLSTYMDHEYPVRSVQIANHIRQVQQAKDSQQDELDNLKEMREMVLGCFSKMIQEKKKKILRALMVKTQKPYEEILMLKTLDSQRLQRCTVWFRELIQQLKEEIPILVAEVEQMYAEVWNPREVVFKDVLLQRPKCTPDMDVELNIPVQELLPF
ncbi:6820408C15Rik [Phodopus roborovskii]|uniref:6820408C15Rik protein n=1 Tax=Phodopus roborovskii TaxID=109678 RepID=A0AAU9YP90_PHORO|nr:6820408C15Rik [Phodopus roborovskii]